mgnify:CR=1 FL=1
MLSKDIDIGYDIILKNKIPILVQSEEWKNIYGDIKDKKIDDAKEKLLELLKHKKELSNKLEKLKKDKRKTMVTIINLSHKVNSNNDCDSIDKLDESKENIIDINTDIEDLKFKLEMIPSQIRQANYELLKNTIRYSYKDLKKMESELKPLNEEIDELRDKLKGLIEQKNDYEERINDTYTFLHGILGGKEMEKLDKEFFK